MKYFDSYIILTFIVKIIFIILALTNIYLEAKGKKNSSLATEINYWKKRVEFIFKILMALLLIYYSDLKLTF